MTSRFHTVQEWARIKSGTYVSSNSPGGGTGGDVCHLRLHLICLLSFVRWTRGCGNSITAYCALHSYSIPDKIFGLRVLEPQDALRILGSARRSGPWIHC